MIKVLIVLVLLGMLIFWVFGSYMIAFQEWLFEHDDQTKGGDNNA